MLMPLARADGAPGVGRAGAKHIYAALLGEHGGGLGAIDEVTQSTSRSFLAGLLDAVSHIDNAMPSNPRALAAWLDRGHEQTTRAYRHYLDERRAGAPRRFFSNRSHALYFLKAVAPTKLVDGAWLYGLLRFWRDARMLPLIRTYLEELGDGVPAQHHVLLYRKLLAEHGCDRWHELGEEHHLQGAIQLSLAHHADELLPEVIGFNLGYEQLPLHLPITAYELNELDIDPYYFSLHVTIDNASTGHARKALQCALDLLPRAADPAAFYRRLVAGFKLNELGLGTMQAIDSFDLDQELNAVLADKARVGAALHSDYCRIGGRTVAEWLTPPGGIPEFLAALVAAGWIRRGRAPDESRFWGLLHDEKAPMFGVFDDYEKQLLRDWIVAPPHGEAEPGGPRRPNVNRFRRHAQGTAGGSGEHASLR
ncbi:MAG: iron-containing redox enzyme family protein, partial [Pseudomonadota bacterium]|nr:iron-containing redox enzyme family protein [Pseudomonadota bacterium]